jgi:hypothetical protein
MAFASCEMKYREKFLSLRLINQAQRMKTYGGGWRYNSTILDLNTR